MAKAAEARTRSRIGRCSFGGVGVGVGKHPVRCPAAPAKGRPPTIKIGRDQRGGEYRLGLI